MPCMYQRVGWHRLLSLQLLNPPLPPPDCLRLTTLSGVQNALDFLNKDEIPMMPSKMHILIAVSLHPFVSTALGSLPLLHKHVRCAHLPGLVELPWFN